MYGMYICVYCLCMQQLADNFAKMNKQINEKFRLKFLICLTIFVFLTYILMHIYDRKNNSQSIQKESEQQSKLFNYLEQNQTIKNATHVNGTLMESVNTKNIYFESEQRSKLFNYREQNQTIINATHINGTLMESVNVNYTRNIYFSVKTTHKYYTERLFPLLLTWLQTVDKNQVS